MSVSAGERARGSSFNEKESARAICVTARAGRLWGRPIHPSWIAATVIQLALEVKKVSHPNPVLFDCTPIHRGHRETVELLCKPEGAPEGGPWCVCSPQAISALKHKVPIACADLPWKCPFASEITSTPTS